MPGMSGKDLAVRIKQMTPSQPILMISAYVTEDCDCQNPVDEVLNKPFSFQDLRQAIARLVNSD